MAGRPVRLPECGLPELDHRVGRDVRVGDAPAARLPQSTFHSLGMTLGSFSDAGDAPSSRLLTICPACRARRLEARDAATHGAGADEVLNVP